MYVRTPFVVYEIVHWGGGNKSLRDPGSQLRLSMGRREIMAKANEWDGKNTKIIWYMYYYQGAPILIPYTRYLVSTKSHRIKVLSGPFTDSYIQQWIVWVPRFSLESSYSGGIRSAWDQGAKRTCQEAVFSPLYTQQVGLDMPFLTCFDRHRTIITSTRF